MTTHINPNDLRVRRTRKHLQQAFTELLSEKDFEEVTIQDIADRAEVNRATFYKHFQDKFELMDVTIGRLFTEALSEWLPDDAIVSEETLKTLMKTLYDWNTAKQPCGHYPIVYASLIESITKQHLYKVLYRSLQQTPSLAHCEPTRIDMAATMMNWSLYGMALQWRKNNTEISESLLHDACLLVMSGITILSSP